MFLDSLKNLFDITLLDFIHHTLSGVIDKLLFIVQRIMFWFFFFYKVYVSINDKIVLILNFITMFIAQ